MATVTTESRATATIEAVIIRADGTRIDLGTIASSKKKNIFQKTKRDGE